MSTRTFAFSLVLVCSLACFTLAQDNGISGDADGLAETATQVEILGLIERLQQNVKTNSELIRNNTEVAKQLRESMVELEQLLKSDVARQSEILTEQQKILSAISQTDSEGNPIPRISGNMQNAEFAKDMRTAVKEAFPRTGQLHIRNLMTGSQTVQVNNRSITVPAGQIAVTEVPLGNVIVAIPGLQTTVWNVSAPNFKTRIRIVPSTTPVTVTTARPIYVDSFYNWYP